MKRNVTLAAMLALGLTACGQAEDEANTSALGNGTWGVDCEMNSGDMNLHFGLLQDDGPDGDPNDNPDGGPDGDPNGGPDGGPDGDMGDNGDGDGDEPAYSKEELKMDNDSGAFTYSSGEYEDSGCSAPFMTFKMEGDFVTGDDAASGSEVEGATSIDIKVKSFTITPYDEQMIKYINGEFPGTQPMCEVTVSAGQPIEYNDCPDFFGGGDEGDKDCDGGPPTPGSTWYQVFDVNDAETELYWGQTSCQYDGSSPSKRPRTLDKEAPMKKL